jgi:EF-hand domain pair
MSVSSVNSGAAYAYLQSLLQQASGSGSGSSDPITSLLQSFYPNGADSSSNPVAATDAMASGSASPCAGGTQFSSDALGAMISMQSQQSWQPLADRVQSVFTQFDTDGDGAISKSEFENAFGSNADTSKVDALFSALDTNGDGSISLDELTSDAQSSQAMHHHHHHSHGSGNSGSGGAGGSDPLAELMSAIQGASSSTTNNPDGSTTTTITYADGSTVTMDTPAASSSGQSADGGSGSQNPAFNFLEQLIQLQAQWLQQSASSITTPLPSA